MKKSIIKTLNLLAFFLSASVFAQDLPTIVPPSPEAASLGKFAEVPISHYTGLPNISIPITSFNLGSKSFPVSLSYHARGVRVEEIASRTGIGWALNAGGQISRQIRSTADDRTGGYINRNNVLLDNLWQTNQGQGFFRNQAIRTAFLQIDADHSFPNDIHVDQFNIQTGNLSAKFIFNPKDDEPLVQSYNDIKIEYSIGDISTTEQPAGISASNKLLSFIVTDKDGYKYYFGVSKDQNRKARNWERVIGNYQFPSFDDYSYDSPVEELAFNSWMLMDIESPNGNLVSFIYEIERSEFYRRSYDELIQPSGDVISFVNRIEGNQYQLKEILHQSGKIVFEANDVRQDLRTFTSPSPKELDKVKIYNTNNNLIKTFELYHSYPATAPASHSNANTLLVGLEAEAAKRLRLDSIKEVGKNNFSKPPYTLSYFDEPMPNRFSNSQDLWGYYNGEDNGPFLTYYGTDNRTVNENKSYAGMLERITYPTGGSTKFVFEHNKGVLGTEYDHIIFPKVNPTSSRNEGMTHLNGANYINGQYEKIILINDVYGQVEFDVSLPTINNINHNVECANPVLSGCGFDIRLEGINDTLQNYHNIYAGITTFAVEAGEYRLVIEPNASLNWNPNPPNTPVFSVIMNWEEQALSQDVALYSSGKRIKKIEFYDSGDNLVSIKEYSYLNNSGGESGIILSVPFFGSLNPNFNGSNYNVYELQSAVPGSPFNTYQGNTIGYKTVTEYFGDANNNHGKTQYEFLVTKDTGEFYEAPITPPTDNEWLRGLPRHIRSYKNNNGVYKKVKEIKNDYAYAENYLLPLIFTPSSHRWDTQLDWSPPTNDLSEEGLLYEVTDRSYRLPFIHIYHPYNSSGTPTSSEIHYQTYHFTGGTLGNFKTTETLYDDNENPTLVTETETTYDYNNHYQPSMVTSVTSDGIPVIQTFTYPQNIAAGNRSAAEQELVDQNRLIPIETKTYRDENLDGFPGFAAPGELKSTTKTTYTDWGSGIVEPSLIQTSKGTDPLQDRIEFKDYDSDGNILQVSKTDGMDITYIYGYDNTLPVAKIENATYAQVQSYVANIQNKSDLDDDRCMDSGSCDEKNLRTALNVLRSAMPNAMVTTYTYNPLIGITSMTDPKGYTIYYEYDDLNRLVRVKDEDGNIMSENKYHYLLDN
jgi:hypothetical protein